MDDEVLVDEEAWALGDQNGDGQVPVKLGEVHARVVRTIRPRVTAGLSAQQGREDLYQSNRFGLPTAHAVLDRPDP